MGTVSAPFTPQQVDFINQYQVGVLSALPGHPFTCPHRDAPHHGNEGGDTGVLIATQKGMECPYCSHTQVWVHSFMAKAPEAEAEGVIERLLRGRMDKQTHAIQVIEKRLAAYFTPPEPFRTIRYNQPEEAEMASRFWHLRGVMAASLNRRKLELLGVQVLAIDADLNADSEKPEAPKIHPIFGGEMDAGKRTISPNDSWHNIKNNPLPLSSSVLLLLQAQTINNPGHPGYGCNAWVRECDVPEHGGILTTEGALTHWRLLTAAEKSAKLEKLRQSVLKSPQLTAEEVLGAHILLLNAAILNGCQDIKSIASEFAPVSDKDHAMVIAEQFALLIAPDKAEQVKALALQWYESMTPNRGPEFLRSFIQYAISK